MKRIIYLLTCVAAWATVTKAQSPYNLASVATEVKSGANLVTHLENFEVEVESLEKLHMKVHRIFSVLNEDEQQALFFTAYSSKYVSLDDVDIKVYDGNGKQRAKFKKKDMTTVATGEGLIEDGYVTYYRIPASSFPVLVEIEYDLKFKSTLVFPDFRFIDEKEGVVESNFTARVPSHLQLRYKAEQTTIKPEIADNGKYKTYKWSVKNLAPIHYEEGAASGGGVYPHIKIAAEKFSHYGFEGDFSSWKSFGLWIKDLYQGLDVLPADRQQFFANMVQNAPNDTEKIRRIYSYLQQNFRYVSIQLGIGGLRPFSADFTDKKKYGDCKALSNYMKAALKAVGIPSHVAIINASYDQLPVDPEFPSNDFNHVILCVPGKKDSIWLECTSSTSEFGELGTFTENRNALLITDNGGVLVPTPKSRSSANILSTRSRVKIDQDLSALTETFFKTKGSYREVLADTYKDKRDEQKQTIVSYFGFKQPDDFAWSKDEAGASGSKLEMALSKLPEFNSGNKLFISPRIYKMWSKGLPRSEKRKHDFYFRHPFEKMDTTVYQLQPGMKPEALPKETQVSCAFAAYQSKCWYNENENAIYSTTTLILKEHRIPASSYMEVKGFFDKVMQDDAQKIVVIRSEPEKKAF